MLNAFWLNTLPTLYPRAFDGFALAMLVAVPLAFLGVSTPILWCFVLPLLAVVAVLDTFMDHKMQRTLWPRGNHIKPLATRLAGSRVMLFLLLPNLLLFAQLKSATLPATAAVPLMLAVLVVGLLSMLATLSLKNYVFRRYNARS